MLFSLISTTRKVLDTIEIDSVTIPTIQGEIQVLPHHLPVLGVTKPGILKVVKAGTKEPETYALGSGIYEVDAEGIRIIADMVAKDSEINHEDIQKKKEEAKQFMTQAQKDGLHNTAEYLAAEENYLKQTALEQLAKKN
ncbi:MAG: ATP synthase F1 subunit epsilon [Candidatus Gracilibacteria bacterium]